MALWLDVQYLRLLSANLRNFKQKSSDLYNFSCPICGDSKSNKTKARGFAFPNKGELKFHCHNCSATRTIGNLIKELNPPLYHEYLMERLKNEGKAPKEIVDENKFKTAAPKFIDIKSCNYDTIADLRIDHYARKYIASRQIPKSFYDKIYYTKSFKEYCDDVFPDHGKNILADERVVIPFFDRNGECIGCQGRALAKSTDSRYKYITVKRSADDHKMYGLDRYNFDEPGFVVEGPFDSMFLPNCVATTGSNLVDALKHVNKNNSTFVFDNQPREPQVTKLIKRAIDYGCRVFIYPEDIHEKDINDLILAGHTSSSLVTLINARTYSGPAAILNFNQWKKI